MFSSNFLAVVHICNIYTYPFPTFSKTKITFCFLEILRKYVYGRTARPPSSFFLEGKIQPGFRLLQYNKCLLCWTLSCCLHFNGRWNSWGRRAREQSFVSFTFSWSKMTRISIVTKTPRALLKTNNGVKGPVWLLKNWDVLMTLRQWVLTHSV